MIRLFITIGAINTFSPANCNLWYCPHGTQSDRSIHFSRFSFMTWIPSSPALPRSFLPRRRYVPRADSGHRRPEGVAEEPRTHEDEGVQVSSRDA